MRIILDTISLSTREFFIEKKSELIIKSKTNCKTNESIAHFVCFNHKGNKIYGTGASIDSPELKEYGVKTIITNGFLNINYSISKFSSKGKHNFNVVNDEELQQQCKDLQKILESAGVICNLLECEIKRLDIAKDIETQYPFSNYSSIFKQINFSRTFSQEYRTSYYVGNNSHGLVIYDKIEQSNSKKVELPKKYQGKNLLRCEYRIKSKRKLRELTGTVRFGDIVANPNLAESCYLKYLRKPFLI